MKRCYLYLFILIEMCCLSELAAKSCGKVFKGNDPAVRYVGRTLVSSDGSVSFDWVSRSSGVLNMTEMMRFIDVRGDEKITYRVVRIFYSDKTSLVWLADNLRATKYADGTDIEANNFKKTPASLGEGRVKAYGVHYRSGYHF